ncbi:protein of unknown function [Denitratisoma oestradiolicum]|uniref:Uncharacterized protein n=1 Tax=Denitratisoma oestradiolicum TaxID=311182 RepID=A0A6S6XTY8_9PROT|nr:protein of unknown function [Denitratisoma oestradiolicum]
MREALLRAAEAGRLCKAGRGTGVGGVQFAFTHFILGGGLATIRIKNGL